MTATLTRYYLALTRYRLARIDRILERMKS